MEADPSVRATRNNLDALWRTQSGTRDVGEDVSLHICENDRDCCRHSNPSLYVAVASDWK